MKKTKTLTIPWLLFTIVLWCSELEAAAPVDWTVESSFAANARMLDALVAPDGRRYVLFLEEHELPGERWTINIAVESGGGFQTEQIATLSPDMEYPTSTTVIRLKQGGGRIWAIWSEALVDRSKLWGIQIAPQRGAVEEIDEGFDQPRMDAVVGDDGLPRVITIPNVAQHLKVYRREPSGTWSPAEILPVDSGPYRSYREVGIAKHGDGLSVYASDSSAFSDSGERLCRLVYHNAVEPASWSDLSFSAGQTIVSESTILAAGWNGIGMVAVTTSGGLPAVTFSSGLGGGKFYLATFATTWQLTDLPIVDLRSGGVTDLVAGAGGRLYLTWATTGDLNYAVYSAGVLDSGSTDIRGFPTPSLTLLPGDIPQLTYLNRDQSEVQNSIPTDYTDADGDGMPFLLERALFTDPEIPDYGEGVVLGEHVSGGDRFQTMTYRGRAGGSGDNPYVTAEFEYYAEFSTDAINWSSAPQHVILTDRFTITNRFTVSEYRSAYPIASGRREFMRIRIVRL